LVPHAVSLFLETLRKYPLKPFVYKICTTDYNENNFNLSKDLLLFVSIFGIHHDAQNYVNAELFDPDRFSEENEKFIDSAKYLPFGGASKNDLGMYVPPVTREYIEKDLHYIKDVVNLQIVA
jgi:cytochrome P450